MSPTQTATTKAHDAAPAPAVGKALAAVIGQLYEPIRPELDRVRERYRQELKSDDPYIANLLGYIEDYSGKMLRPALLLLSAKATGQVTDAHITLAAVAEMIHTATLVHDDILDDALVRRQRPSINRLAGNEVSVLLGDHLFSHALEVALTLDNPVGAHRFSRAVSRTCQGEIAQVYNRGNLEIDEAIYYRIVRGKTAELYATSAELGPVYTGAGAQAAQSMYDFGMNLGIAFQIMDDLLDLRGDEATVGKTLGTDVANGKATLPIIHHLSGLNGKARESALGLLRDGAIPGARDRIVAALRGSGSIDYTEKTAHGYVAAAKKSVSFLGAHPMREFFENIADFVVTREL